MDSTYDDNFDIQVTSLKDFFTILPNDFLQTADISSDAMAAACYLASHSPKFIPRPRDIKKRFKWGEHVWRRVSKELKEIGWLTEIRTAAGSILKFVVRWRNKPGAQQNQPTVGNQRSGIADRRKSTVIISKDLDHDPDQDLRNKQQQDHELKSSFKCKNTDQEKVMQALSDLGIELSVAEGWCSSYESSYIQQKITLLGTFVLIGNKQAWLQSALTNDFKPTQSPPTNVRHLGAYVPFTQENYEASAKAAALRSDPDDWREAALKQRMAKG